MQRSSDALPLVLPDDVLAAYCPILYLHHDDHHLPVSVEWYIERAHLNYYVNGVTSTGELGELSSVPDGVINLISAGNLTQEKLLEAQAACTQPDNLSITVSKDHYGGCRVDELQQVPVYVHAKLVVDEEGAPEAYEINYITFYAFNGHYDIPANLPLLRVGHHVGDWEHLTVRLDAASLQLQGVWYNAHRNIEGEWCPAAQVPRSPCGRILGFVAISGHGIYPHCGIIPRLFFMANDRTSRKGPVWAPRRLVRLCGLDHGSCCPVVPSRGCSLPPVPLRSSRGVSHPAGFPPQPSCPGGVQLVLSGGGRAAARPAAQQGNAARNPTAVQNLDAEAEAADSSDELLQHNQGAVRDPGAGRDSGFQTGKPTRMSVIGLSSAVQAPVLTPDMSREGGDRPGDGMSGPIPAAAVEAQPQAAAAAGCGAAVMEAAGGEGGGGCSPKAGGCVGLRRGCGCGGGAADAEARSGGFPLPQVLHDTSPWQRYRGRWGSVVSATQQGWFLRAEPPVSRGAFKRLCLPCAPGVERLPRKGF